MTPEEKQIWQGIRERDGKVFEAYYKAHYRLFFLASCKYLRDPVVAEEVVNDVFMRIWEDALTLDIQTSLKFYIHRAVVNQSLNALDKNRRERLRREELKEGLLEAAEWEEMEDNELKMRFYKAIDGLPDQCRRVFKLSRFEGLKQQEIADRLGISIKTVKNHITRAMKDLHKVLLDYKHLPLWLMAIKYFFWCHH
ncbi:MAG TPA: RNA polymerase sigma-70 factor [Puia sp.]|nr:RNA polymerase sigma-70 factor [Puia sp.]